MNKWIGILVFFASCGAQAMTVAQYQRYMSSDTALIKSYVGGLSVAFEVANSELGGKNQQLLFCAPRNLAINVDMYRQILDEKIARFPISVDKNSAPVEFALLFALQEKFPC